MSFKTKVFLADHVLTSFNLDSIIGNGKAFFLRKHDKSTTVGIIKAPVFGLSHDIWLKRFKYRGFLDFLLKRLFGSRAKRLYNINLRLYEKGLPVAEPLAYIDPSFKNRHSFFISSVIENSETLSQMYKDGRFVEKIASKVAEAIAVWHSKGTFHGDLKWSNILLKKNDKCFEIFFVDLDQARLYSKFNIKGIIKDLLRFYRGGLELGAEEWVDSKFFPQYIAHIPSEIKVDIDLRYIKERALKDWKRKGQKRFRSD